MVLKNLLLFPELILLIALPFMAWVHKFRTTQTAKTFYSVSKFALLLFLLSAWSVSQSKHMLDFWQNNSYILMSKFFLGIGGLFVFFLSCKWFLNKNKSSFFYYSLALTTILGLDVMISSANFILLGISYVLVSVLLYFMLFTGEEDYECGGAEKRYLLFALVFTAMLAAAIFWFYTRCGSFSYAQTALFYAKHKLVFYDYVAFSALLLPLLFMLGVAPLHFSFAELSGVSILPVYVFRALIPFLAIISLLVNLALNVFQPMSSFLILLLQIVAVISLFWGAISAIKEENLRKMFAFVEIYSIGFILLAFLPFSYNSLSSGLVCMMVFWWAMFGVCSVFFALKSNGEYLTEASEIAGVFTQKPFISVAMIIFIVSLAGSPPMLGFLGKIQAIDNLIKTQSYWCVALAMGASLLLIDAFFSVLHNMFFCVKRKHFDRSDRRIYICLMINMLVFLLGILNPAFFIEQFDIWMKPVLG